LKRTSLYDYHVGHGKMVEFAGYEMPIWYTSITEEHLAVRNAAGIFDVSHMGRTVVSGPGANQFMEALLPTASTTQPIGKAFYTLMLNPEAGIIDDLIAIKRGEQEYLLVINAANKAKDLEQMARISAPYDVSIEDVTDSTTMIAVQGPEASAALQPLVAEDLSQVKRFTHVKTLIRGSDAIVTRTGYTGEDGFEIVLYGSGTEKKDGSMAGTVWTDLASRARPCGLGARDSLRIEAGFPLYGYDIDESTNPVEADLSWVISKGKTGYVGRDAVAAQLATAPQRLRRGIIMDEKIPRHGFSVVSAADGQQQRREVVGKITSGTFSPILKKGIAMAYMDAPDSQIGQSVYVMVRDSRAGGRIVKPPFYDEKVYGWKRVRQQR
jgi:aminomethyltransferase